MKLYIFFVKKTLTSNRKRRSQLMHSIMGITLSMIPMVMLFIIADSIIGGIVVRFLETGTYHIQVKSYLPQDNGIETVLKGMKKKFPQVKEYFTEKTGYGILFSKKTQTAVNVRAIQDKLLKDENFKKYFKIEGKFDISEGSIVIGKGIANKLNVKLGDYIRLITSRDGTMESPQMSSFLIKGIVSVGYQGLDKLWSFISYKSSILNENNSKIIHALKLNDPYILPNRISIQNIDNKFYEELINYSDEYKILSWYDLEIYRYQNFAESRDLIAVVLFVVLIVAVISLFSSMMMFVLEREEEIAFMRCLGFSKKQIGMSFMFLSSTVGFLGVFFGTAIGIFLSVYINEVIAILEFVLNNTFLIFSHDKIKIFNPELYLDRIPVKINFKNIFSISFLALLLCIVSSVIPALFSTRNKPIDVLKKL